MKIINISKVKHFYNRFTEGYVITKPSFDFMGTLLITDRAGFTYSTASNIDIERECTIRILNNETILPTHGPERVGTLQTTLGWQLVVNFEEGIDRLLRERLHLI